MKARILFMGVLFLASLSLAAAPAFAGKSDTSDRKASKEQSQIQRGADKEELKKAWEADKRAREEAEEAFSSSESRQSMPEERSRALMCISTMPTLTEIL